MTTNTPFYIPGPFHWILDWDGTVTEKDTLDVLVNIAASDHRHPPIQQKWEALVAAYIKDYDETFHSLVSDGELPRTTTDERNLLKALKCVEERSVDRVSCSQVFAGLTASLIQEGAVSALEHGTIKIRPGMRSFIERFPESHILSVNWSRHFISSCLDLPKSQIYANELDGVADLKLPTLGKKSVGLISAGPNDMRIVASDDKLRYFEQIKSKTSLPVIYAGDSWTDIECLLAADLGICIRDDPMGSSQQKLADAVERLNVPCPRLRDVTDISSPQVAWAKDFTEIMIWFTKVTDAQ